VRLSGERFQEAKALVARRLGLDFPEHREAELARAIGEAARSARLRSPEAYLATLDHEADGGPEWQRLASLLTVRETSFFRDRACFEALERTVLPGLIAARLAQGTCRLRLWSAGCATGEEAYSLAILLERLLPDRQGWDLTILATDIDVSALEKARRGLYRLWSFRELPPALRDRHFARRASGQFELEAKIRGMVAFEAENLARGASRGPMDLILCRNVLMYLTPEVTEAAVARLQMALAEDGWLVVAPAEASAERFRPLVPVNLPGAIFFRSAGFVEVPAVRAAPPQRARRARGRAAALSPKAPAARMAQPPRERQPPAPPSAPELLARARATADRGGLDEALGLCRAALEKDRLLPEAHRLVAAIHQERGEVEAAVAALRRAVYLDPDSAEAHRALGHLLLKQGERRRGQRHLETAARLGNQAEAS
jgi:chemotaxis protein methyltransferase CheR